MMAVQIAKLNLSIERLPFAKLCPAGRIWDD
jgi:hypothetical protein